jgi:uncharacterized protein YgiM (DUF1202 family)
MTERKQYTVSYPHGLNLREAPSKAAKVIAVLPYGEKVKPSRKKAPDGWIAVAGGYVMKEFIEVT